MRHCRTDGRSGKRRHLPAWRMGRTSIQGRYALESSEQTPVHRDSVDECKTAISADVRVDSKLAAQSDVHLDVE